MGAKDQSGTSQDREKSSVKIGETEKGFFRPDSSFDDLIYNSSLMIWKHFFQEVKNEKIKIFRRSTLESQLSASRDYIKYIAFWNQDLNTVI